MITLCECNAANGCTTMVLMVQIVYTKKSLEGQKCIGCHGKDIMAYCYYITIQTIWGTMV